MRYLYISSLRPAELLSDPEDIAVRIVYDSLLPIPGGYEDFDAAEERLGGLASVESLIERLAPGDSVTIGSVTIECKED